MSILGDSEGYRILIRYRLRIGSATIHSDVSYCTLKFVLVPFRSAGIQVSDRREILQIAMMILPLIIIRLRIIVIGGKQ